MARFPGALRSEAQLDDRLHNQSNIKAKLDDEIAFNQLYRAPVF